MTSKPLTAKTETPLVLPERQGQPDGGEQIGFAILDHDLRFIQVNDRLAEIDRTPVEWHLGKTVGEIDSQVASALDPLLSRLVAENSPGEFQVVVHKRFPEQLPEEVSWLISCHVLRAADETRSGYGLTIRDITGEKAKEEAQAERLRMEALLSDLSTMFINLPVCDVDCKIEECLRRVVEFLGFDRSSIWEVLTERGRLRMTHSFAMPGIAQPPPIIEGLIPVWDAMLRKGEIFSVSDVDELPDLYWREKKFCKDRGGIRSLLFIPAGAGGVVVGTIVFASYRVKREWPAELVQRLRLLWEIFANALERKRADEKMQKALEQIRSLKDRLEAENLYLRDQINIEYKHDEIIGKSEGIQRVLLQVRQVANTDATVLILGETGTGKELIARAIHNQSARKERAMIKVNCAALPATLVEAELFGHEKGAFTGAVSARIGRFEAANGSTIFLDEIGELPLEQQSKLLRVLQEGQFERVGSTKPVNVDVRIVAATNQDLAQAVREGRFREDLYYRLNVFPISVPPLRTRSEDIPFLVSALIKEFAQTFGKRIDSISRKNMEAMQRYHWPGNIRELRNLVERAVILSNSGTLMVELPVPATAAPSSLATLESLERNHIRSVLEKTGWRIRGANGAAEILGMRPTTLHARIKKLGIKKIITLA